MKRFRLEDMKGGWFVGNFTPTAFHATGFEVCYKHHKAGEQWDVHYHKLGTEINLLVQGKMRLQDTLLSAGDIFILEPYEIADPVFLEDCDVVIIKTPSIPGDKYVVSSEETSS